MVITHENGHWIQVFRNGKALNLCSEADTETRSAVCAIKDANGRVSADSAGRVRTGVVPFDYLAWAPGTPEDVRTAEPVASVMAKEAERRLHDGMGCRCALPVDDVSALRRELAAARDNANEWRKAYESAAADCQKKSRQLDELRAVVDSAARSTAKPTDVPVFAVLAYAEAAAASYGVTPEVVRERKAWRRERALRRAGSERWRAEYPAARPFITPPERVSRRGIGDDPVGFEDEEP